MPNGTTFHRFDDPPNNLSTTQKLTQLHRTTPTVTKNTRHGGSGGKTVYVEMDGSKFRRMQRMVPRLRRNNVPLFVVCIPPGILNF
jgi:hypothetical protein